MRGVSYVAFAALIAIGIAIAVLYERLPDPMPIHFDLHGRADGFASRAVAACFVPTIAALLAIGGRFAKNRAMAFSLSATAVFLVALHALVLRVSLDGSMVLGGGLGLLLGIFEVTMGLVFPRLRRNRFVGIRVPWSLASDENWARTHRFGGIVFVLGGAATIVVAAILDGTSSAAVSVVMILGMSAVCVVYSYRIAHGADAL